MDIVYGNDRATREQRENVVGDSNKFGGNDENRANVKTEQTMSTTKLKLLKYPSKKQAVDLLVEDLRSSGRGIYKVTEAINACNCTTKRNYLIIKRSSAKTR